MQLPNDTCQYGIRTRFGRYVARRLTCAQCLDLAQECDAATRALREAGRAEEDTEDAVQEALAWRDAADDVLDTVAKETRHELAARGLKAAREAPYTQVFHAGVEYYTEAPQAEQAPRYEELKARLVEHLDASDPVRAKAIARLDDGLATYADAARSLDAARTAQRMAGTRLEAATTAWNQVLVRAYGTLIARFGKPEAERYFPRVQKSRARKKSDGQQPTDPKSADAKKPLRSVA
jgi:hypothetical protein